jgi:hypothetical protein
VIRLVVPVAGIVLFFFFSLATVRIARPRTPRKFFLLYALLLLAASAATLWFVWPVDSLGDAIAIAACLVLQLVACLTMWNTFYSVLWGFSGTLMYELYTEPGLRDRDRIIRSYQRPDGIDRMMARRLPNLVAGGWLTVEDSSLRLRPKGEWLALGTRAAFRLFSLGMGGGIR